MGQCIEEKGEETPVNKQFQLNMKNPTHPPEKTLEPQSPVLTLSFHKQSSYKQTLLADPSQNWRWN